MEKYIGFNQSGSLVRSVSADRTAELSTTPTSFNKCEGCSKPFLTKPKQYKEETGPEWDSYVKEPLAIAQKSCFIYKSLDPPPPWNASNGVEPTTLNPVLGVPASLRLNPITLRWPRIPIRSCTVLPEIQLPDASFHLWNFQVGGKFIWTMSTITLLPECRVLPAIIQWLIAWTGIAVRGQSIPRSRWWM